MDTYHVLIASTSSRDILIKNVGCSDFAAVLTSLGPKAKVDGAKKLPIKPGNYKAIYLGRVYYICTPINMYTLCGIHISNWENTHTFYVHTNNLCNN